MTDLIHCSAVWR